MAKLEIEIVNGNVDGSLDFEVNGTPNNGKNKVKKKWKVEWKVRQGCNVDYIRDIKMKTPPPASYDIFSNDPPTGQGGPNSKIYKATVNDDPNWFSDYYYDIFWTDKNGNNREYDPKISVMPSFWPIPQKSLRIIFFLLSLFSVGLLWKKFTKK